METIHPAFFQRNIDKPQRPGNREWLIGKYEELWMKHMLETLKKKYKFKKAGQIPVLINIFTKACIPEAEFEKLLDIFRKEELLEFILPTNGADSWWDKRPVLGVQAQWILGNLDYYNRYEAMAEKYQHISLYYDEEDTDEIYAQRMSMVICAGCSGSIDALQWILDHKLIVPLALESKVSYDYISEAELDGYETLNPRLSTMIILSQNIQTLEWAFNRRLIETSIRSLYAAALLDWQEGFQWLFDKFLRGKPEFNPLNYQKLMQNFKDLRNYKTEFAFEFPIEFQLQWLIGNMDYYHLYETYPDADKGNILKEMVFFTGLSGNLKTIHWVLENKLVDTTVGFDFSPFSSWYPEIINPFSLALVLSRDIEALAFGLNKKIIENQETPQNTLLLIINMGWLDGLIYMNTQFPAALNNYCLENGKVNYLPVHCLSITEHIHLLEWYRYFKPDHLSRVDGEGYTMVHYIARHGSTLLLDWFFKYVPALFHDNTNKKELSVMHIAGLGNRMDILDWLENYDSQLKYLPSKDGDNALAHSLKNSYYCIYIFNYLWLRTENPFILKIDANDMAWHSIKYVLESNYLIESIQPVSETKPSEFKIPEKVQAQLERNKLINKIFRVILEGNLDNSSLFYPLIPDILSHILNISLKILDVPICGTNFICNHSFFKLKKENDFPVFSMDLEQKSC